MKKLKKVNEKLKKFDGVNKKALDQFLSFTEQRDDLQSRESSCDLLPAAARTWQCWQLTNSQELGAALCSRSRSNRFMQ
eukprot:COSAG06_NODE_1757_length_8456_cov_13.708867_6_plen_79_part_00